MKYSRRNECVACWVNHFIARALRCFGGIVVADWFDEPVHADERKGREHDLKTWPEFYAALESGEKNFEVRVDDRGFAVGDILLLREWDKAYTGRSLRRRVAYLLRGGEFGLAAGSCCMGLESLT